MIKVMIVEDEPLILNGIRNMIEKTNSFFTVTDIAYDGEEALKKIYASSIDVIFIDVRMPVMDGLTLAGKLKERNIKAIPVILSGYKDFDYAKKALKMGVYDYLLKPISPDTLSELLNDLYTKVNFSNKEQQLKYLNDITNISTFNDTIPTGVDAAGLFSFDKFMCHYLCSGSYSTFPYTWIAPTVDFWMKNNLELLVNKYLKDGNSYWILDGKHINERLIITGYHNKDSENVLSAFKEIHRELSSSGFPITSIITKPIIDVHFIGSSIQNLLITLKKNICFAKSTLICEGDDNIIENIQAPKMTDRNMEKSTTLLFQNGNSEKIKLVLKKILDSCENSSLTQLKLERQILQIFNVFYDSMDFIPENKLLEIDMEINELISLSYTYKSLFEGLCFLIDRLFTIQKCRNEAEENNSIPTERIKEYIKQNYTRPLSLQTLSDTFGLVPHYLSRIFKKHQGISPIDLIINLRIDKAKELLGVEPPISLKDIAEAVGFSDQFYLSKVFKAITGKCPSEYRNETLHNK